MTARSADGNDSRTASDLMTRDVVTVTPDATVREALDLMSENHVHGLPVLSANDKCIGVITASDILAVEQEHAARSEESIGSFYDQDVQRWETMRLSPDDERLDDIEVKDVMTRELVSVSPDTPFVDVAENMLKNDVHRVFVLDDDKFLCGIIAAFDFVRLAAGELR